MQIAVIEYDREFAASLELIKAPSDEKIGCNVLRSVGIVRRLDTLGRIVIPKELRKALSIDKDTPLEIFVEGDFIILRTYNSSCIFCKSEEGIQYFKGQRLCTEYPKELSDGG